MCSFLSGTRHHLSQRLLAHHASFFICLSSFTCFFINQVDGNEAFWSLPLGWVICTNQYGRGFGSILIVLETLGLTLNSGGVISVYPFHIPTQTMWPLCWGERTEWILVGQKKNLSHAVKRSDFGLVRID